MFSLVTFPMYISEYAVKHARFEVSTNQFRNLSIVNRRFGHFENMLEINFFLEKHNAMVHLNSRTEYETKMSSER